VDANEEMHLKRKSELNGSLDDEAAAALLSADIRAWLNPGDDRFSTIPTRLVLRQ
jgi:hypothetical protein